MMNNQTIKLCIDFDRYNQIVRTTLFMWRLCVVLTFLIGVPGHLFQIITLLRRTYRKESTSVYLIAIALFESIFLTGTLWYWSVSVGLIRFDPRQVLSCGIFYNILVGSTCLSNLYLALLCIDRSIMILWPVQYRIRTTSCSVLRKIIIVGILMIVSLIPNHFYLYYDRKTTLFLCEFHSAIDRRRFWLWTLIHAIVFVSIPSFSVCIFSAILLFNRYKHHRQHRQTESLPALRMFNRSIVILFVSLALCVSILPVCILQIFIVHDQFFPDDPWCSTQWKIYRILLNCFLILSSLNYSMKFYVHLIISTSFRKHFLQWITCQKTEDRLISTQMRLVKEEQKMINTSDLQQTYPNDF